MVEPERLTMMNDELSKNVGAVAAIAYGIPSAFLAFKHDQPYVNQQNHVGDIQTSINQLEIAKTLVGSSKAVQPAIKHLDAQIASESKTLVGVEQHTPNNLTLNETFGVIFGPALVVGIATWAMVHKARVGRARERATYKALAKELMQDSRERPAPYGPMFNPTQIEL